jgi:MFS family permease
MTIGSEPRAGVAESQSGVPNSVRTRAGFWLIAWVYLVAMLGGTLPVPLYIYWAPQMGFGPFTTTLIFAAYAVGVVVSLLVFAPWSDQSGRRPSLAVSLAAIAASTVCLLVASDVATLLVGRVLSGLATGVVTATATAAMEDLAGKRTSHRVSMFATAANLGGLGLGALIAGVIAQFTSGPTDVVFGVYLIVLAPAAIAVALTPETVVSRGIRAVSVRRPAMPDAPSDRTAFACAGAAVFAVFAVNGLFTSLVPAFLRDQLHMASVAMVGAVVGLLFLIALATQLVAPASWVESPIVAPLFIIGGVIGFESGLWVASVPVFVAGTTLAGVGAGLAFRHGVALTARVAEPSRRANLFATFFLLAYAGATVPTLALGLLDEVVGQNVATLILAIGVIAVVIAGAVVRLRRRSLDDADHTSSDTNTPTKGQLP